MRLRSTEEASATRALGDLLRIYWKPLYVFARKHQLTPADAEDAVQSFCEKLIRRDALQRVEESQGRLRAFLLTAFQHHLRSLHRDEHRLKRGRAATFLSLEDAEAVVNLPSVQADSPDRAFDKRWAHALLEDVLGQLKAIYVERGQGETFRVMEPALVWNEASMSYEEMAAQLGMSAPAVAQAVHRLRLRYRELLEQAIADTVDGPQALAEERAYLIRALSGQ